MGLHNIHRLGDVSVALDFMPIIRRLDGCHEVAVYDGATEALVWHTVPAASVHWELMTPFFQGSDDAHEVCFNLAAVTSFDVALDDPSVVRVDVLATGVVRVDNDGSQLAGLLAVFDRPAPLLQLDDDLLELYIVHPVVAGRIVRELSGVCVVELQDAEGVYEDVILAGGRDQAAATIHALMTR
jgi:hypothetical protein